MALFKNTGCLVFNDTAFFDQNCSSQMMADAEEAEIIISAHEKEQVEQHVEEEIVHEVVSPDQSWRNDESGLIHELEHSEEDDDGSHGSARGKDESRSNADMADHAYHASLAEGEDSSLDDPFKDDTGVFCLDTEDEVKQKIATYEKKSGTRFIVLKKERGYTQTEWKFKRLSWSQKSTNTVAIKFDGTPFMYLGQVLLGCHHGKDKNTGIKKKYREKVAKRTQSKEDDYRPTKRLLSPATKKLDCPAVMSIKKVAKFPDFKVSANATTHTRRKKFQEIGAVMKETPEALNPEIKFYLEIPVVSRHKNHPVGLEYAKTLPPRVSRPSARRMTFWEVKRAAQRLKNFINMTPIHRSATVDQLTGRKVFFKAELFQKTGSFKIRGALNAILCLRERSVPFNGVVTHSSGNHGQGLAYAAQLTGTQCTVVVPHNTPGVKVQAIMNYGASVIFCEPTQASRSETCARVQEEEGYHYISPYDDYDVIAGQGTIGLELLEQCPDVQAVLIPTSGGGLASGIATAVKGRNKQVQIFCVEPEGKDLEKSLRHGKRLWPNPPRSLTTVADAIRTQQLGKLTFPILREKAEKEVFTVNDQDIVAAMKFAWTRLKLLIEPAAATGVAALFSERMREMDPAMEKVAVILCGGNVDLEKLPWPQVQPE
ncbi:uncharacterized protein LOC110988368 isoform X2 [Acanthaster planci]|uniref:Serine racemase n=1 Tax=Acanthaster planci TaxID=133434 RepID=A0A8B7ZPI0_ACAPL|nr:uncharacterized protein LOC110988368 isoform X2 [Acanthaster planci]